MTTLEVTYGSSDLIEVTYGGADEVTIRYAGVAGPQGETGATGATGAGVPVGGSSGQVLAKASGTDYDTEWSDGFDAITATIHPYFAVSNILSSTLGQGQIWIRVSQVGVKPIKGIALQVITSAGDITFRVGEAPHNERQPLAGAVEQATTGTVPCPAVGYAEIDFSPATSVPVSKRTLFAITVNDNSLRYRGVAGAVIASMNLGLIMRGYDPAAPVLDPDNVFIGMGCFVGVEA